VAVYAAFRGVKPPEEDLRASGESDDAELEGAPEGSPEETPEEASEERAR